MAHRINKTRAVELITQLMAIPGPSGGEVAVAGFIKDALRAAGVAANRMRHDNAHKRSGRGGAVGNLIVQLPGSKGRGREPRRLLMAHMDTVPICVGCKPRRRGGVIESADPATGLGADNRSGCAAVLIAALELLEHGLPHPPLTLLWTVQEEVGLVGARHVEVSKLGRPAMGFNFDGGSPSQIIVSATGAVRMAITVRGVASHAGTHPERGVSATAIAAKAVAQLHDDGWHGLVVKGKQRGTSNVGVIEGGKATNVVTEQLALRAEARSHNARFRGRIVEQYRKAFGRAAKAVRNEAGQCGAVEFTASQDYDSFSLPRTSDCVKQAVAAMASLGREPLVRSCDGGLDANWMTEHGVPTVTLGAGAHDIHTVDETLDIAEFVDGCRLAMRFAGA